MTGHSLVIAFTQLALVTFAQDFPSTITLQGLVRDFSSFHPDFEAPVDWNSEQRGLYLPELTRYPDERPVFIPPELRTPESLSIIRSRRLSVQPTTTQYALSNFGKFFHDEYYVDVPGVNVAIPIEINLALIDPVNGIYNYRSNGFFPINDQGYTRELLDITPFTQQTDAGRTRNYWFTTEFRIRFFYRGGEIFNFNGDDDLWVFINGQLTTCDLGSIHVARACSIDLDSYGMLPNSTNQMVILHAERHWRGSSFELTTSIVPINTAPVATGSTVVMKESTPVEFRLSGFDPDYNGGLQFMILTAPQHGLLSVNVNEWFPKDTKIKFTPEQFFTGNDTLTYIMNDGEANSTVATTMFLINPVNNAPVPISSEYRVVVGQNITFQLQAQDIDTAQQDLRFYLASTPQHGYVRMDSKNLGMIVYEAVTVGTETLRWQVSDETFYVDGLTTIIVETDDDGSKIGNLKKDQVAGIVVGGIVALVLGGAALTYMIYHFVAAKRFEKIWAEEFKNAQMMQNPLYQSASTERFNPLYMNKNDL